MPKNPDPAWAELERRWRGLFASLQGGGEAPPGRRLRTEGLMEAMVLLDVASESAVQDALENCYIEAFGEPLPGDWRELFPFPQIPGFGRRAPVFPSAKD